MQVLCVLYHHGAHNSGARMRVRPVIASVNDE